MPTTLVQPLPYPTQGAVPDVPADLKLLAEAVETRAVMRFASIAARDAALPTGSRVAGMLAWVDATQTYYVWSTSGIPSWLVVWSAQATTAMLVEHPEYRVGIRHRAGSIFIWANGSNSLAYPLQWNIASIATESLRPLGGGAEGVLRASGASIAIGAMEVSTGGNVVIHNRHAATVTGGWQASASYVR